jgi:3-isopropylmalate/(R)-2-methylmalate dehydratase large subunit
MPDCILRDRTTMKRTTRAMTAPEKILARAAGRDAVSPGEVIYPIPELVVVHDGAVETAWRELSGLGYRAITRPDRVIFVTDHEVVYATQRAVERARIIRRIAKEWGIRALYDVGRGGHGHIFPIEDGLVRPGMFLISYDMHCTNYGAVGALCQMVGTEISTVLATGTIWMQVPHTLRVRLHGRMRDGVQARDVGFVLAHGFATRRWGVEYDYRIVEFCGPALADLQRHERVALCNSITEMGVNNVYFEPTPAQIAAGSYGDFASDPDARHEATIDLDLDAIVPQVALPGGPDRAADLASVAGRAIDHAYVGACGSGMYEDFVAAATAMRGRRVAPGVRMFVVPGTVATAQRLAAEGYVQAFMDAGAIVLPPGCGPCAGGAMGPLGPGEVSIATAATNHAGRFGAHDAEIYLASPATVAASAVCGCIADPREQVPQASGRAG